MFFSSFLAQASLCDMQSFSKYLTHVYHECRTSSRLKQSQFKDDLIRSISDSKSFSDFVRHFENKLGDNYLPVYPGVYLVSSLAKEISELLGCDTSEIYESADNFYWAQKIHKRKIYFAELRGGDVKIDPLDTIIDEQIDPYNGMPMFFFIVSKNETEAQSILNDRLRHPLNPLKLLAPNISFEQEEMYAPIFGTFFSSDEVIIQSPNPAKIMNFFARYGYKDFLERNSFIAGSSEFCAYYDEAATDITYNNKTSKIPNFWSVVNLKDSVVMQNEDFSEFFGENVSIRLALDFCARNENFKIIYNGDRELFRLLPKNIALNFETICKKSDYSKETNALLKLVAQEYGQKTL